MLYLLYSILLLLSLDIEAHFVPGEDVTSIVCETIDSAKEEVLVQAYNFTDPDIGNALIAAHKRRVRVTVIVDRVTVNQKGCQAEPCFKAGIPVFVDAKHKIAHNKIMVVDSATVLTGSFNWSQNAEKFNAENLVKITKNPTIAAEYLKNWEVHKNHSEGYEPTPAKPKPKPKHEQIQHPTNPKVKK